MNGLTEGFERRRIETTPLYSEANDTLSPNPSPSCHADFTTAAKQQEIALDDLLVRISVTTRKTRHLFVRTV